MIEHFECECRERKTRVCLCVSVSDCIIRNDARLSVSKWPKERK